MADWLGQASWLLQPLVERIADHVMASVKLHADDTPVPVLAPGTGKTATGRLWVSFAITDDGAIWTSQQRCSAIAPIARASDFVSISSPLQASFRPMPMPVSSASTRVTASQRPSSGRTARRSPSMTVAVAAGREDLVQRSARHQPFGVERLVPAEQVAGRRDDAGIAEPRRGIDVGRGDEGRSPRIIARRPAGHDRPVVIVAAVAHASGVKILAFR